MVSMLRQGFGIDDQVVKEIKDKLALEITKQLINHSA
jgi:hypothetical protein